MALEDILAAIRSAAEAEIARIEADATAEVSSIEDEAAVRAAAAYAQGRTSRDAAAARDADRIVNHARLEADRQVHDAVERVYQEVLHRVTARMATLRAGSVYPTVFTQLWDECRSVLPSGSRLIIDPRDRARATELLATGPGIEIEESLETSGGMVLVTSDGRHIDNTFETRLARADPYARQLTTDLVPGPGAQP